MSTTALGTARPALRSASRPAAVAALLVAVGHLPMARDELRDAPVLAALSVLLCLGCGHCARSLWHRPTQRAWQAAVVMAAGMFVLPALMPPSVVPSAHPAAGSTVAAPATTGMADMADRPALGASAAVAGAGGSDVAEAAGAVLEGPVSSAARWSLLLLGGWALVRGRVRRGTPEAPPA